MIQELEQIEYRHGMLKTGMTVSDLPVVKRIHRVLCKLDKSLK